MASFELTGTLKVKQDTQRVSDKFSKREFVVTTDMHTPYPQYINFQLTQDKCSLLDSFQVGEEMKVSFNLRGREWVNPNKNITQYFNSLEAWRIEKVGATQGYSTPAPAASNQHIDVMPSNEFVDDLPF